MAHNPQTDLAARCPSCGAGHLHRRLVTERFPYEADGETVTVVAENVPVQVCDKCGEELSGPDAARIRHEAICRALGLMTPAEIQSVREQLGFTQVEFARMTRLGVATICRWERGRLLQNPAMDRYLRLIALGEDNVRFLKRLQDPKQGVPGIQETSTRRRENGRRNHSQGGKLMEQFVERRPHFLQSALADAKKWCAAPDTLVGNKRTDQFWIRLFSPALKPLTADDAQGFLRAYQLTNRVTWDTKAVAAQMNTFRKKDISDIRESIGELADALGRCISARGGRRISAASKIAFFAKPLEEVFIWDQFAKKSARFRDFCDCRGGYGDYLSYYASCAKALDAERHRDDFTAAVQDFRAYLGQVGGPMADSAIMNGSSFIERRLLDKLMFWEGKWLAELQPVGA